MTQGKNREQDGPIGFLVNKNTSALLGGRDPHATLFWWVNLGDAPIVLRWAHIHVVTDQEVREEHDRSKTPPGIFFGVLQANQLLTLQPGEFLHYALTHRNLVQAIENLPETLEFAMSCSIVGDDEHERVAWPGIAFGAATFQARRS